MKSETITLAIAFALAPAMALIGGLVVVPIVSATFIGTSIVALALQKNYLWILKKVYNIIQFSYKSPKHMLQIRCADCGCYPINCKHSNSPKECPSCSSLEECCCWKSLHNNTY